MQKAKQAVSKIISHDGKQKTTVDETVGKAVTEEQVRPHQHENVTTAVDKEVHQDHHHTTVQPLKAKEVLPEQHVHNVAPTEHKTFNHGNDSDIRSKLDHEAAKFKDTSMTHGTTHSSSTAPTVSGERTHHHVHEHVQPVIQKETVAPKVVHTTVPVHETHHASAVHHGTSTLPAKPLEEFTSSGGALDGRGQAKLGDFDRSPKPYNKDLQSGHHDGTHSGESNSSHAGHDSINGPGHHAAKPSMMDKLNPFKDADGDGKKGLMD